MSSIVAFDARIQLVMVAPRLVATLYRRAYATAVSARGNFKRLTAEDVAAFRSMVEEPDRSVLSTIGDGKDQATASKDDLLPYNEDWMQKYRGSSQVVLRPRSTAEASRLMAYCSQQSIAVVPQGGNTGLVGGGVPVHDEVVLSVGAMTQVRNFDTRSGTLACDAGCVLQMLDERVAQDGYMIPLDLGAKGSCMIGGNVATNAGWFAFAAIWLVAWIRLRVRSGLTR